MTPTDSDPLHNEDVAHEHSDINVRAIVVFLVVLTVVTVFAGVAMYGLFRFLESRAAKFDPPQSPVAMPATQIPRTTTQSPEFGNAPHPRLLTNEPAALGKLRDDERKRLETYGWVNESAGVARVPITEAKKLLLQRGLPARAGESVDPRLGTRAAAMSDASSGRRAVVPQKVPAAQPPAQEAPKTERKPGGGH
jgi:hypothetical protein